MRWTKVAGVLQFGAHLDWSASKVSLFEVLESSFFWWKKVFNWTRRRNFSKPRLIENSSVFLTLSNLQRNHSLIQHSLHCDWKTAENRGGELGSLVKYYYYYYYYHYYFFFLLVVAKRWYKWLFEVASIMQTDQCPKITKGGASSSW